MADGDQAIGDRGSVCPLLHLLLQPSYNVFFMPNPLAIWLFPSIHGRVNEGSIFDEN